MKASLDAWAAAILAPAAYPLESLKKDYGLGVAALRTARRKGLIVRRIGRRSFVLGSDLLKYIETCGKVV